jgi:pimeloyl-ACP methyl ester carboxylesterase
MFINRMLAIAPVLLATLAPRAAGGQSTGAVTAAAVKPAQPARTGYATVNGLRMYYEIHGTRRNGTPLVLLHGGGSTIGTNFGRVIPLLTETREVIAVELQAHGHTRDIDRPFTFAQDADDVAALLKQLHVAKADVLGFSNGGTTALQVAIRHPEVVDRLVIASANYRRDGMAPGFWDFMKKGTFADMPQPYKDAYLAITPSQDGVMAMYQRDSRRMLAFEDIPDRDVHAIEAPALVVVGDSDVIRPEHALELSRLLPHGRLCVLPGNHGSYMGEIMTPVVDGEAPRAFVSIVTQFLSSPTSTTGAKQ